ncbi:MAG: diguanylate cyclase [bacterium]
MEQKYALVDMEIQLAELRRQLEFYIQRTAKNDGYINWLEDSLRHYRSIVDSISDYIYTVIINNGEPVETIHEQGCLSVTGYYPDDFKEMPMLWIEMVHKDDREAVKQYAKDVISGKYVEPLEHRIICKDKTERWVENTIIPRFDHAGNLTAYDGIVSDITIRCMAKRELERNREMLEELVEQRTGELTEMISQLEIEINERKHAEEIIRHMAMHDTLTDLPNRNMLYDHINHAFSIADRNGTLVGLLYIDLDGFKGVNDLCGHEGGDAILNELSKRLKGALRKSDLLARIGGDEFVALIENLRSVCDAMEVGGKIIELLRQPVEVGGRQLTVGASIGISIYPNDGSNIYQMLNRADIAMYNVKTNGKNGYALYSVVSENGNGSGDRLGEREHG